MEETLFNFFKLGCLAVRPQWANQMFHLIFESPCPQQGFTEDLQLKDSAKYSRVLIYSAKYKLLKFYSILLSSDPEIWN